MTKLKASKKKRRDNKRKMNKPSEKEKRKEAK